MFATVTTLFVVPIIYSLSADQTSGRSRAPVDEQEQQVEPHPSGIMCNVQSDATRRT